MNIEHPKEKLRGRLIVILLIAPVFFLVIFLFAHYRIINARKPNIKDVINGSKLHDSLIKSGKLNYTIEYVKTELGAKYEKEIQEEGHVFLLSQLYDVTYYFENDKFRYDISSRAIEWLSLNNQEEEIKADIEYIYDGETATRIDRIFGNISANITNYIDHLYPYTASIKLWGMELNIKPLAEILQYSDTRIIGFEDLHGESCYVIEMKPSIDIGGYFKIWVNPKRGYLIQKLEAIQKDKKNLPTQWKTNSKNILMEFGFHHTG